MRTRGLLATVASVATVAFTLGNAANANGTETGGHGHTYALTNNLRDLEETEVSLGRYDDAVYVGDYNGDGRDTLAVRRGSTFHVRHSLADGDPDEVFQLGQEGDSYLVGDWDGDGIDTFAVRRGSEYRIYNTLVPGPEPDRIVTFGLPGETVIVGDFDGDGRDTLAAVYGPLFIIKDDLTTGVGGYRLKHGRFGAEPLVGDWNGDGTDTLAFRRSTTYSVSDGSTGLSDQSLSYGDSQDAVLVGDWNGDGTDSFGRRKASSAFEVDPSMTDEETLGMVDQSAGGIVGFAQDAEAWAGDLFRQLKGGQ